MTVTLQSDVWLVKRIPTLDLLEAAGVSRSEARRLIRSGTKEMLTGDVLTEETLLAFTGHPWDGVFYIGKTLRIEVLPRVLTPAEKARVWLARHGFDFDGMLPVEGEGKLVPA